MAAGLLRWLLLLGSLAPRALGYFSRGEIHQKDSQFAFIDKFCYDNEGGYLTMTVTPNREHVNQKILFFHDMEGGWPSIADGHSCKFKESRAQSVFNANDPEFSQPGGFVRPVYGTRPRWWYVAVSDCDENEHQNVSIAEYTISFQNVANSNSHFKKEFSFDQEGIYEAQIFTACMLLVLMAVLAHAAKKQVEENVTQIYKALLVIVFLEFTSCLFGIIHNESFASNGQGIPFLNYLHTLMDIPTKTLTFLFFILLAKGWQFGATNELVADSKGSWAGVKDIRSVVDAFLVVSVAQVVLTVWQTANVDRAVSESAFAGEPGFVMLGLRIVMWLWFLSSIRGLSYWEDEGGDSNKCFHFFLAVFGSFWFLSLPVVVILSTYVDSWYRKKVVDIFYLLVSVLTYTTLFSLFKFWAPSATAQHRVGHHRMRGSDDGELEMDDNYAENSERSLTEPSKQRHNTAADPTEAGIGDIGIALKVTTPKREKKKEKPESSSSSEFEDEEDDEEEHEI